MKTMSISTFKVHALKIIDNVTKTHESIVITKRGKALAELIPFCSSGNKAIPGRLASALVFEKDIVTPLGKNLWEVCK